MNFKGQLTERQVTTLLAIIAHYRVFQEPVPRIKLNRFLKTVDEASGQIVMSNVYRLSRLGLVKEDESGMSPTTNGEDYASGCRFICMRRFGPNAEMAVYGPP